MRYDVITIFPHIFDSYFSESILKRALEKKIIDIRMHDLRDWTTDKHKTVDDTPYGGGAGMVMKVEPIFRCVEEIELKALDPESRLSSPGHIRSPKTRVILFSARGKRYLQKDAARLLQYDQLILICGRYEGIDERVAENIADEEISIGDFVLTGGEIPAAVVIDSMTRLMSGVLGNEQSSVVESHSQEGYLEYPQYTKPDEFHGWKVPEVLLGGNHAEIEMWRKKHSGQR
jgi:tRNA (guanine37-N1)-methyltransferase